MKYIRKNKNSYSIVKNSKTFARVEDLDDAIFIRDLLVLKDWNMDNFTENYYMRNSNYFYLKVIDGKIHFLGEFGKILDEDTLKKYVSSKTINPNGSKYGLNITRIFDNYIVRKQIAGDEYVFGVFDNLEDAAFVRDFLLVNEWDVNAFSQIEHDGENGNYKIIEVIDDRVYVLGTFKSQSEAQKNIQNSKAEFINRIYKHKYGLSQHPHLEALKDKVDELKDEFQLGKVDDFWSFENVSDSGSALDKVVFNLTPWQKTVYDAIGDDNVTIDDLKLKLTMYKSKNFDEKIMKYLNELEGLEMVKKLDDGSYVKV